MARFLAFPRKIVENAGKYENSDGSVWKMHIFSGFRIILGWFWQALLGDGFLEQHRKTIKKSSYKSSYKYPGPMECPKTTGHGQKDDF